jgi:hypothetical protein
MSTQSFATSVPFGYDQSASGVTRAGADKYPNPFCDIASEFVPRDLNMVFEWCEYIYLTHGTYRSASRRVVRYFLTELVLEGASDDEREKYEDFLNNKLKLMRVLSDVGDDYMVYGNCFLSIYFPFDRYLICPNCHTTYHVKTIDYKFNAAKGIFTGKCDCSDKPVEFKREDRRSPDKERVQIIRWNPKQIRIRVHPVSHKTEYYLEIDPQLTRRICEGEKFYIDEMPWSMLSCIIDSTKGKSLPMFKFKPDAIYHLHDATLAGIPIRGWAIPPIMPNFRLAYYIQLLRRYDEAIALDFIVPFRVLYPSAQPGPGGFDPLQTMSMSNFIGYMQNMVDRKRKNIADIQVAPFPIGYQMIGGEAKELAPKEQIAQALDELLNAIGYPAELYKGTLTIQAFPVALRLFEKTWGVLVDGMNDFIAWLLKSLARHFMWGEVTGALRSVTLADDIERKALALQAAAGQDISKSTAYRNMNIDYLEEQKRVVEEQEEIQKLQQEAAERAQAQAMGLSGGGDASGQSGAGGTVGATPGDVYEQGKQLAQQLLIQTPPTLRRGELIKIKQTNPTLHAIVIQEMDNMRGEMARQGQAMMMQQAQQQGMGGKAASALNPASDMASPVLLGALIAGQLESFTRNDLRKLASDIKTIPEVRKTFHWVYSRMRGWE